MERNQGHQENREQSAGRPAPEPIKSRSTRLQETLDRVRAAKAPPADPTEPERLIHRARNEATEREMSELPWCGAAMAPEGNNATILNCDVTCPKCIEIIGRLQVERGEVDLTHFDAGSGRGLCGVTMSAVAEAQTLRETRCEHCLAIAEEVLVGIIKEGPSKWPKDGGYTLIDIAAAVVVLREICQTLKDLVDLQRRNVDKE